MKLADALATTLRDWDLRYVFGVSGANIEHLHDSIHRLGDRRLQAVLARSEVGAAFMADCRARVHRTLGVCCSTSGGGMMNLAVGLAESFAESVPVLAIVGQVPAALEGRGGFQDSSGLGRTVEASQLFRAIAKHVARVDSAATFWEKLHAAAVAALSGRPGPAVLLVPRDMNDLEVRPRPSWFPATLAELLPPATVPHRDLERLFEGLRGAQSPALIVGTGVDRALAPGAVQEFAASAQIPVATTMANPAAFPQDHPLYLGVVGAAGHPSAHAYLNDRADLIVAVGTGLDLLTRHPIGPALARARMAVVNIDPGQILRTLDPEIVVAADAGLAFQALNELWRSRPFAHPPLAGYARTCYRPILLEPQDRSGPELRQSEAIAELDRHVPEAGHLLFDAGNCAAAALHALTIPRGTTSTIALGMGGMGYAIAGAIGAQLGDGSGRTVVVAGDGAFLMLGFEIHTAVALDLPILFVIFNNNRHGMCASRQRLFFGGRIACVDYPPLDVARVVRGFGPLSRLWVGQAATRREVAAQLDAYRARPRPGPGVLELRIGLEEMPPFSPFLDANAPTEVVGAPGERSAA